MRMPSGAAALILFLLIWAALFAWQPHFPGWLGDLVPGLLGCAFASILGAMRDRMRNYVPTSKLDAKITNEKIKLTAQSLNAMPIAIFGLWIANKIFAENGNPFSSPVVALYMAFAVLCHWMARQTFNFLKDEEAFTVTGFKAQS